AVGLPAAIAAALAHGLVDDHALGRVGIEAALAPPPLLRRAGLVVDDGGNPGNLPELVLQPVELVAMIDRRPRRERTACRIFFRLVADDGDALQAPRSG